MEAQSQIKRTLSQPQSIDAIRRLLANGSHATRSSLAKTVCSAFSFFDARGHAQSAGCVKALRELEQASTTAQIQVTTVLMDAMVTGCQQRLKMPRPDAYRPLAIADGVR